MITAAEKNEKSEEGSWGGARTKKAKREKNKNKFSMWPEYELSERFSLCWCAKVLFFAKRKIGNQQKKKFFFFFAFEFFFLLPWWEGKKIALRKIFLLLSKNLKLENFPPHRFFHAMNNAYRELSHPPTTVTWDAPKKVRCETTRSIRINFATVWWVDEKLDVIRRHIFSRSISRLIAHAICIALDILQSRKFFFHPIFRRRRDSGAWKKFVMDFRSDGESFLLVQPYGANHLRTKDQWSVHRQKMINCVISSSVKSQNIFALFARWKTNLLKVKWWI